MVEGWITQLYRNGHEQQHRGSVSFTGNDFYNYESHVSTVKYQTKQNKNKNKNKTKQRLSLVGTRYTSIETDRKFELFAGLLYSLYEVSENEKFPFLRPQFAHVIREVHDDVPLSWDSYEKYDPLPSPLPLISPLLSSPHILIHHTHLPML